MYVIYYRGFFEEGYVKVVFFGKTKKVTLNTITESLEFASKFRFRFIANIFCRLYNADSQRYFKLITYKVEKL